MERLTGEIKRVKTDRMKREGGRGVAERVRARCGEISGSASDRGGN